MIPQDQNCGNCRFFDLEGVQDDDQGFCMRFPPPTPGGNAWPIVNTDRWCGEWKAEQE